MVFVMYGIAVHLPQFVIHMWLPGSESAEKVSWAASIVCDNTVLALELAGVVTAQASHGRLSAGLVDHAEQQAMQSSRS